MNECRQLLCQGHVGKNSALYGGTCFTRQEAETMLAPQWARVTRKYLEAVLAEFRRGIAHHPAQGATEDRIRQILGEANHLAFSASKRPGAEGMALRGVQQSCTSGADPHEQPGKPDAALTSRSPSKPLNTSSALCFPPPTRSCAVRNI